jgi:hypothetical protein
MEAQLGPTGSKKISTSFHCSPSLTFHSSPSLPLTSPSPRCLQCPDRPQRRLTDRRHWLTAPIRQLVEVKVELDP